MSEPRPLKLMPDYGCHPIWWDTASPSWGATWREIGNVDPADLGLSADLQRDLRAWAEAFDARLDWDDPAATVVAPETDAEFRAEGAALAVRLAAELGDSATVRYAY